MLPVQNVAMVGMNYALRTQIRTVGFALLSFSLWQNIVESRRRNIARPAGTSERFTRRSTLLLISDLFFARGSFIRSVSIGSTKAGRPVFMNARKLE